MKKRLLATIPVLLVVFLCSITINEVHAEQTPYAYSKNGDSIYYYDNNNNEIGLLTINIVSYNGENRNMTYEPFMYTQQNSQYMASDVEVRYFSMHNIVTVRLTNETDDYLIADTGAFSIDVYTGINNFFNQMGFFGHFENIGSNIAPRFTINTKVSGRDTVTLYWEHESGLVLNPHETIIYYFDFVLDFNDVVMLNNYSYLNVSLLRNSNSTITWTRKPNSFDIKTTEEFIEDNTIPNSIIAYLDTIQNRLKNFFDSYNNNLNNSANVTNGSNSLENQSDTIHNTETGYYTQTNTALANTGLSNYTFSSDVVGGMGKVKDQFTYVWNKLGNYNVVYTFSLTLGIALLIIRHVRPIRRKKEE